MHSMERVVCKVDVTSLHFTSLHFTSLHFTSLHFTMYSKATNMVIMNNSFFHSTIFFLPQIACWYEDEFVLLLNITHYINMSDCNIGLAVKCFFFQDSSKRKPLFLFDTTVDHRIGILNHYPKVMF